MPMNRDDGYSEHGLGHLLNPDEPESDSRAWIRTIWTGLVMEALGQPFTWPSWCERPAMSRITASSPQLLRPLTSRANGMGDRVQPFNFLISPHVAPLGHPAGVDPPRFLWWRRTRTTHGNGASCAGPMFTRVTISG